ncbi:MAG: DEAD/DEAH box helicase [Prevotella sp.]|nr:DEAD/DEAH box helicase [Prevotella sp.]
MNSLRNYQTDMLQRLHKAWIRNQSVMVQMPTGTGKTVLLAEVIRETLDSGTSPVGSEKAGVLIVAHRRELVEQIKQTIDSFGIDRERESVRVESIQKLSRHISEIDYKLALVIIDEAHHALAKTYRMLWEKWPKVKFLGLTATPCRLNNAPFTDLFQTLLQSYSIQEFIDKGWLSDFEYVSAAPNSAAMKQIRSLQKRGADGDYQQKELATVMDVPESIEHLYKTYKQFADGKKGIVYAIDRKHARHITEYYRAQGVNCCLIDGKTSVLERKKLIDDYLTGKINVLTSIDCFSEGFDAPEVEFIQLARPTLSLSKYLQQVGRGMRVSRGKPHVLILDNVGLYQIFGLPTEERDWRLTFYGQTNGKGTTNGSRCVILDEERGEKELVNLQMVRIKKSGKRGTGLEIFLKDGKYGIRNNGHISCPARFKEIVRLNIKDYYATGIYSGFLNNCYVEFATLIDRKGIDLDVRLFKNVIWKGSYFYSNYKPRGYKKGGHFWSVYWDPKGNCYYDYDPRFHIIAGVEVAETHEHFNPQALCYKLRYNIGNVSPRFNYNEIFYNRQIIIARDYLIVKKDHNHAYQICAFLNDSVLVRQEGENRFLQIYMDGRKGGQYHSIPPNAKQSILQVQMLGLKRI